MTVQWGQYYFDHYEKHLRNLTGQSVFRQDDQSPSIQVLWYDKVFSGCRVFATLGLSHYSNSLGKVAEILVSVDSGWTDIPYLVANVLFYIVQHQMKLGWGMGVSGLGTINPDFAKMYNKEALYITNPSAFPEVLSHVRCNGATGDILMGLFLSKSEYAYFEQHGADKLEELLDMKEVDPFSLERPSVI
jgi:hypothetical protein